MLIHLYVWTSDNEHQTTFGADFGLDGFVGTVARTDNIRLKEIKKRRALFGNQTVVLLTNSGALTNSCASNPFFFLLL